MCLEKDPFCKVAVDSQSLDTEIRSWLVERLNVRLMNVVVVTCPYRCEVDPDEERHSYSLFLPFLLQRKACLRFLLTGTGRINCLIPLVFMINEMLIVVCLPRCRFERSLILVQDALLCKLGSNYAEFEPDIEAAGALDVSTSQEITDRTIRDCVVANSASGLIKLMMDNIALFEN